MRAFTLIGLLPVALACLNENTNKCASYIKSNAATASPFCASFTRSVVTATAGLPAWATNCDNKPRLLSAECSCHYTGGGPAPTTSRSTSAGTTMTTTTRTTTGGGSNPPAPTGVTTTLPRSSGAVATNKAIVISNSFDGGMKAYDRSRELPSGQASRVRVLTTTQRVSVKTRMRLVRLMPCSFLNLARPCPTLLSDLTKQREFTAVANGKSYS